MYLMEGGRAGPKNNQGGGSHGDGLLLWTRQGREIIWRGGGKRLVWEPCERTR